MAAKKKAKEVKRRVPDDVLAAVIAMSMDDALRAMSTELANRVLSGIRTRGYEIRPIRKGK